MQLKELKHAVDVTLQNMPRYADWEVVVPVALGGCGAQPHVKVRGASAGFDWDSGLFLIHPDASVVPKCGPSPKHKLTPDMKQYLTELIRVFDMRVKGRKANAVFASGGLKIWEQKLYTRAKELLKADSPHLVT